MLRALSDRRFIPQRGLTQGARLGWQIERQTFLPTQQPPGRKSGVDPDGNHMLMPCVFSLEGKRISWLATFLGLCAELPV